MTRNYGIFAIAILLFSLISACGSDSSSEARSIIKKQTNITEDYVNGLTDAKSADDVVKAIDNFTEGMKKLVPDLLEFQKKYPEFKGGKVPEGLDAEVKKLEEVSAKMSEAMMKMAQYMMDPKVQEAMTRMGEEMGKLNNN